LWLFFALVFSRPVQGWALEQRWDTDQAASAQP